MSRLVTLGEVLRHRKGSIIIDDAVEYKRCRVQLHRRGVEMRDIVPGTVIKTKKQQLCKTGDFIVAEMDAKFGGYGFLNESLDGAIVSSHYYLFEVITEKMLPEYLAVINKTDILQNQIKAKGSTNYSAVRPIDVLGWTIPLPSLAEQQRIIDEVEVTEKEQQLLLPEFEQQLTHLTQLRQALLREAMQGQLLPQDPTDEPAAVLLKKLQATQAATGKTGKRKQKELFAPEAEVVEGFFEIPRTWLWTELAEVCSAVVDCPHSTPIFLDSPTGFYCIDTTSTNEKGEIVRLRNVSEETYQLRIDRLEPTAGDIVYSREGSFGVATILPEGKRFCLGQRVMLLRLDGVSNEYIKHIIASEFYKRKLTEKQRGLGAKHINVKDVKLLPIPLPPLAEQHRIVAKLEHLLQHCEALEQRIRESRRLAEQLLATALREALAPPAGVEAAVVAAGEAAEATPRRRRGSTSNWHHTGDLFA